MLWIAATLGAVCVAMGGACVPAGAASVSDLPDGCAVYSPDPIWLQCENTSVIDPGYYGPAAIAYPPCADPGPCAVDALRWTGSAWAQVELPNPRGADAYLGGWRVWAQPLGNGWQWTWQQATTGWLAVPTGELIHRTGTFRYDGNCDVLGPPNTNAATLARWRSGIVRGTTATGTSPWCNLSYYS
jgi:hypothetical protein